MKGRSVLTFFLLLTIAFVLPDFFFYDTPVRTSEVGLKDVVVIRKHAK